MSKITIAQIRAHNKASGRLWFERKTMAYFASKIESVPYSGSGGTYFISSERTGFHSDSPREYNIRQYLPDGEIRTIGKGTWDITEARSKARKLAKGII